MVKKSSICWFLNSHKEKLSSDRLERVQQREVFKNTTVDQVQNAESTQQLDQIFIGDWCLFQEKNKPGLIGLILSFAYMDKATWRATEYSSGYANVSGNKQTVGVLCTWYSVGSNKKLKREKMETEGYLDIGCYKMTIFNVTKINNSHFISSDAFNKIKKYL